MFIALGVLAALLIIVFLFEFRIKQPDKIVLYESSGKVRERKGKYYPRHFSLAVNNTTHSIVMNVEAEAKGKVPIMVKLAVTVAAAEQKIAQLIRAGGWEKDAVKNAAKELDLVIQGEVREYTSQYEIEELSSEAIRKYLQGKSAENAISFGLEVISLSIQSVDPTNDEIAEAIRKREEARITEKTEELNQQARINEAEYKMKADEKILDYEHQLELKRYELKNQEFEKESQLSQKKLQEELRKKRMKLDLDKEEMSVLNDNPQLLMLTPQIARLAEASQNLKNAKTVVSLGNEQGSQIIQLLHGFLNNLVDITSNNKKKETK
jgi:translation elongation factor EF-1beta